MHFQTPVNLVISGASGFVGSAVAEAADRALAAGRLSGVRRVARNLAGLPDGAHGFVGDLADPRTLAVALEGAHLLIHAAGYRGPDPALQQRVNVEGTRALVDAAHAAGVDRMILVSTTAVYGSGAHRGEAEGQLTPHPESSLSESRLAAEEIVLSEGGHVVRADLAYGAGDRWVVPGLVRVQRLLGGAVDGGAPLTSAIAVSELGRLLVALALAEGHVQPRVWHAAAHPVPMSALIGAVEAAAGLRLPDRAIPASAAAPLLMNAGWTAHQIDLISADHWFDGTALWELTGLRPGAAPEIDPRAAEWYSRILNTNQP
jgi:nucleoside-diphosphate-sugar epimerase